MYTSVSSPLKHYILFYIVMLLKSPTTEPLVYKGVLIIPGCGGRHTGHTDREVLAGQTLEVRVYSHVNSCRRSLNQLLYSPCKHQKQTGQWIHLLHLTLPTVDSGHLTQDKYMYTVIIALIPTTHSPHAFKEGNLQMVFMLR